MTTILGILLRHALTGVGAILISRGLDPTSADTLVGALTIVGGLVASYIQKRLAERK